jgi:Uma2 family endonuclease
VSSPARAAAADLGLDQRVFLHNVSWKQYERLLELRGDDPAPRMTYLEGELELMSPSREHETIKTMIARLLEAYALAKGIRLDGYGSMTMKSRPRARGAEADECYMVGGPKARPDIAIEVVWTHGGLDKLEVYRGLRVREVWLYRGGRIEVYALRRNAYIRIPRSEVLPRLELAQLLRYASASNQTDAVRRYLKALRARRKA